MKRRSWKMWILPGFFLTRDVRRVRSRDCEWIPDDVIPFLHLWCQRTWWRHTPLCIYFTPTQGRIIKYQILFLQIKFVSWQISFEFFWIYFHLFFFVQQRTALEMASIESIFFFKFKFFRFFFGIFWHFFIFFFVNPAINLGFQFFLPLILKIMTRIFLHNCPTLVGIQWRTNFLTIFLPLNELGVNEFSSLIRIL